MRVLQAQCQAQTRVGLLRYDTVARGAQDVRARIAALRAEGVRIAVADALHDADLRTLAEGCSDLPLLTAGSGLAIGLPERYERQGQVQRQADASKLDAMSGRAVLLAGSCSLATNAQVAHWRDAGRPARALDVRALLRGEAERAAELQAVAAWAQETMDAHDVPLVFSTVPAAELSALQAEAGALPAGERVEQALAALAVRLAGHGAQRFIVAGGETSGAVVQALGVRALRIGTAICPGVPWTQALPARAGAVGLWLALKSGNFGGPDFFSVALQAGAQA